MFGNVREGGREDFGFFDFFDMFLNCCHVSLELPAVAIQRTGYFPDFTGNFFLLVKTKIAKNKKNESTT